MKSTFLEVVVGILILLGSMSCYADRIDGPYKGKLVYADTGQPIEGVVVLGTWSRELVTPGGAVHRYYDAKETVTDRKGDFEIKGLGRLFMSNIMPMDVLIFKTGYEYMGLWPWESFRVDTILRQKVKWEGDRAIIPLRKLTMAERGKELDPNYPSEAPEGVIRLLLREINKDRAERGLRPVN